LPPGQNNFPMYVTLILDILDPLFKIIWKKSNHWTYEGE
jgi:hypothetical protein